MKHTFKHSLLLVTSLFVSYAHGQTTPIDQVAPGPHILFEARNIKPLNDAMAPSLTFDLYMSASQAYVDYINTNGQDFAFQSCDVAFDVDFGTDGTALSPSVQSIANEATVTSPKVAFINAPVNLAGASPAGFDTRFKYVVVRTEASEDLTTTPTHVGSVKLTWNPGIVIGTPENGAKIQIRSAATGYNTGPTGSKWGDMSGNSANQIGTSAATNAVPLPVKLAAFNANAEGRQVNLAWSTTEEVNCDHFDVERSKNGKQWTVITSVKALGESKALQHYQAVDSNPFAGNNLYRLHIIDKDGSNTYSAVRSVKMEEVMLSMYPNPVSNILTIAAPDFARISKVRIINANGKEVYQSGAKPQDQIDVSKFSAGMYIVNLRNLDGDERSYKVVVTK